MTDCNVASQDIRDAGLGLYFAVRQSDKRDGAFNVLRLQGKNDAGIHSGFVSGDPSRPVTWFIPQEFPAYSSSLEYRMMERLRDCAMDVCSCRLMRTDGSHPVEDDNLLISTQPRDVTVKRHSAIATMTIDSLYRLPAFQTYILAVISNSVRDLRTNKYPGFVQVVNDIYVSSQQRFSPGDLLSVRLMPDNITACIRVLSADVAGAVNVELHIVGQYALRKTYDIVSTTSARIADAEVLINMPLGYIEILPDQAGG